jgi:cell division protein FtsB
MENSDFESAELLTLLKQSEAKVQQYVAALKSENLRLQRKIASLEAKNVSLNYKIKILEEYKKAHPDLHTMTDEDLIEEIEKTKQEFSDEMLQEIAKSKGLTLVKST